MSGFESLKKQSQLQSLTEQLAKETKGNFEVDERMWYPDRDQAGNGYAVIRFLPAPEGEDIPWQKLYTHRFKHGNRWFIENCPTTIGKDCPVCSHNKELFNSGQKSKEDLARKRKRNLSYFSNVYIVSDPANPENEGQVRILKYGKRIWDMIRDKLQPEVVENDPDPEKPVNVFDFWKGANFKMKIRKVEGRTNYDKSSFEDPSVLGDMTDEELEKIYNSLHSLKEFASEDKFKTYEELEEKFETQILQKPTGSSPFCEESYQETGNSSPMSEEDTPTLDNSVNSDEDLDDIEAYTQKLAQELE